MCFIGLVVDCYFLFTLSSLRYLNHVVYGKYVCGKNNMEVGQELKIYRERERKREGKHYFKVKSINGIR